MTNTELAHAKKEALAEEHTTQGKFYLPMTDIMEYEDRLVLQMDMPGNSKKDINLNIEDGKLKIESSFDSDRYKGLTPLYSEYNVGPFTRTFTLSTKIDQNQIEASMDNGVLSITLPKKVELARQIVIR